MPNHCPCVVTLVARNDRIVWMRIIGALDLDAEPALAAAVTRLGELAPDAVVVDLAGVTFAGAVLCRLLIRMRRHIPGTSIRMDHASPSTRLVMIVTGTDHLVVHGEEEELPWNAS